MTHFFYLEDLCIIDSTGARRPFAGIIIAQFRGTQPEGLQIAGVHVPVSRAETTLTDGDTVLVCRLNFRLVDPKRKADRNYVPQRNDYEYCAVEYSA